MVEKILKFDPSKLKNRDLEHKIDTNKSNESKIIQFPEPQINNLDEFLEHKDFVGKVQQDNTVTLYVQDNYMLNDPSDSLDSKTKRNYDKLNPLFKNFDVTNYEGRFNLKKVKEHLIEFYDDYFHDLTRGFVYKIIKPIFESTESSQRRVFDVAYYAMHLNFRGILMEDNAHEYKLILQQFKNEDDIRLRNVSSQLDSYLRFAFPMNKEKVFLDAKEI